MRERSVDPSFDVSVNVISAVVVASFDVTASDVEVSYTRDSSALVTTSLASSLLFMLASSPLATRGKLSAGVVVGVVIVIVPDVSLIPPASVFQRAT